MTPVADGNWKHSIPAGIQYYAKKLFSWICLTGATLQGAGGPWPSLLFDKFFSWKDV